jgi:calpain-15
LAALAEYKNLIERLFEYYDTDNGYFLVWICIDGFWKLIELDGYIPVVPTGDRPAFSHGDQEELWVILLEKAYAKAYGNYEKINGGQPYEAIKDLTGAPGQSFCHRREEVKAEELWRKLDAANKEQFIMTCGTDVDTTGTIKMEGHSESVTNEGLVLGHAYSILDVREYKGQRLIQLRNPWGETEWKGDWSDKSKKWTEQARKELGYSVSAEDGIFWMPF